MRWKLFTRGIKVRKVRRAIQGDPGPAGRDGKDSTELNTLREERNEFREELNKFRQSLSQIHDELLATTYEEIARMQQVVTSETERMCALSDSIAAKK